MFFCMFVSSIVGLIVCSQVSLFVCLFSYKFDCKQKLICYTPGPRLMRIHLVQNSISAKIQKSPNIHLVPPIIHLQGVYTQNLMF